ncbi:ATP-binding cassette domain-containing protein [Bacillus horti]|uniref:ABC-2 type transport system ATP-binding protein n=1 Tax=Caldalkalibacillus horti TaxID=77523 RepID=A0ABT9VW60_9BACI|nr:ATP-binding cassette domain-containing protein [Bacillus horti]MDQ0165109.1 ABC-2 type transport system ATP-binding protein [Bacillus horti]
MHDSVISVLDLKKSYGAHTVLDGLSFEVARGTIFALLGENGSGKTTTIRILSTLTMADHGSVRIAGLDINHAPNDVKKLISLTGQYASVDELLTGEENLFIMGRLNHLASKKVKERTRELLEQFDLVDAAKKLVKTYSGGMRRRLDIAISLFSNPEIIFLDEPTTGLDPRSRKNMWDLIQQLAKTGVTIFLTTQYLEEADQLADEIAIMNGGRIVQKGTAEDLKRMIGNEKVELGFNQLGYLEKANHLLQGQMDTTSLTLSLNTKGQTEELRNLLNVLHEHGIEPTSVEFRKPTLDDVFLSITSPAAERSAV